jgi:uncharacterized protein (TIGR03067 family)
MKRLTALLCLATIWSAALAGQDDASKADLKRFQGKWKVVSIVHDGARQKLTGPPSIYDFVGNKNVYSGRGNFDVLTLKANETPKAFDFDAFDEKGKLIGKGLKAIYAFDGDSLKLCVAFKPGTARPKAFDSTEKSGHRLIVLQRVKE